MTERAGTSEGKKRMRVEGDDLHGVAVMAELRTGGGDGVTVSKME